jgi:hypothetical protein
LILIGQFASGNYLKTDIISALGALYSRKSPKMYVHERKKCEYIGRLSNAEMCLLVDTLGNNKTLHQDKFSK